MARGLWHEMNCLMHDCDPYGHLMVGSAPMQPAQLARLVGITSKECTALLAELEVAGVFSRTESGAIFSRRMVRDEEVRERRASGGGAGAEHGQKGAIHGAKGGRPRKLMGGSETPLTEARKPPPAFASTSASAEVSVETGVSTSSADADLLGDDPDSGKSGGKLRLPPCPHEQIVSLYHQVLPELPGVRVLDDERRKAIRALWAFPLTQKRLDGSDRATGAAGALEWIREYFNQARHDDWLMGRVGRTGDHKNWRCTLEFLSTSKCIKRVLEQTEVTA
jgi:hypothetical protein